MVAATIGAGTAADVAVGTAAQMDDDGNSKQKRGHAEQMSAIHESSLDGCKFQACVCTTCVCCYVASVISFSALTPMLTVRARCFPSARVVSLVSVSWRVERSSVAAASSYRYKIKPLVAPFSATTAPPPPPPPPPALTLFNAAVLTSAGVGALKPPRPT